MSKLDRRAFAAVAVGAGLMPGASLSGLAETVDPIFAAIAEWRVASDYFWSLDGIPEAEMNAACEAESAAGLRALTTVPTTLQGLKAFCEFGETVSVAEHGRDESLSNWAPGYASADKRADAESLFMNTLSKAARNLLPS